MTHRWRHDEIERFCRNFLHGNGHQQLHERNGNYEREFSQIDIQQFTKETFDGSFQSICNDVFTYRPVSNGYIIAILSNTQTSLLIFVVHYSLLTVLEGIGFHHEQLAPSRSIIL